MIVLSHFWDIHESALAKGWKQLVLQIHGSSRFCITSVLGYLNLYELYFTLIMSQILSRRLVLTLVDLKPLWFILQLAFKQKIIQKWMLINRYRIVHVLTNVVKATWSWCVSCPLSCQDGQWNAITNHLTIFKKRFSGHVSVSTSRHYKHISN